MTIGEVIRMLRKDKKVDSNDMAVELDITPNYLSLIENNKKSPSLHLLRRVAFYFNIPLSEIFLIQEEAE